jgi:hypothetical protein
MRGYFRLRRDYMFTDDPITASKLKLDDEALARVEEYARKNLVCIKCGKPIPDGDAFKMHLEPSKDGEGLDVRIAHMPCFGLEADGKTKWEPKKYFKGGLQ